MLTPQFASEYAYLIYDYVVGAKDFYDGKLTDFARVGFRAPDAQTLVVTLKSPTPYLMKIIASHYAWTPVPVKVIAQYGPVDRKRTGWTRAGRLVSNGPFLLKDWTPNQKIVVARNPHYWDAATVKLDEIHFPDGGHPNGRADVPHRPVAQNQRTAQRQDRRVSQGVPGGAASRTVPRSLFLPDQCRPSAFHRQAGAQGARPRHRSRVGGQEYHPRWSTARPTAVSYPGTAGYSPRAKLEGGIAEAKRLLAEAGYPEGKGFPDAELLYNTNENHRAIAEAIQQMWRRNLGIEVRLLNQEWKVYLDSQHTKNFMLQRAGWIADYVDPHVFLEIWVSGNGNNDTNWSNAAYDQLFQQALTAKTDAERYEIYQKMDAILVDEVPVIPIYHYTRVYAMSPKVKGHSPTLLDNHPYKYLWLEP
jgi:oligopeptide transport system substrate-binding protein